MPQKSYFESMFVVDIILFSKGSPLLSDQWEMILSRSFEVSQSHTLTLNGAASHQRALATPGGSFKDWWAVHRALLLPYSRRSHRLSWGSKHGRLALPEASHGGLLPRRAACRLADVAQMR